MKSFIATCVILAAFHSNVFGADNTPQTISLWQNGAPGFESRKDIPEAAASSYSIKSINNPSLTVFLPPREKAHFSF